MKSLIIALPGMGNTLLAVPLIRELKKSYTDMEIDVLVGLKSSKIVLEDCPYIKKVYLIDTKINKNIFNTLKVLMKLRKNNYDYSFTTFPAKQGQYNILARLINAKKRITHDYRTKLVKLHNILIPIKIIHDIKQNLNLLLPLGIKKVSPRLEMWIENKNPKTKNEEFVVGIHPGSSLERGMAKKRWDPKNFSRLIDLMLLKHKKFRFKIFIGPAEEDLEVIKELSTNPSKIDVVKKDLKETIIEISNCDLFISNDSGLMHIAAIKDVPTVGIFLSTDERRTFPFCDKKLILKRGEPYRLFRQSIERLRGSHLDINKSRFQNISPEYAFEEIERFVKTLK